MFRVTLSVLVAGSAQWCSQGIRVVKTSDPETEVEALDLDYKEGDGIATANSSLIATEVRRRKPCTPFGPTATYRRAPDGVVASSYLVSGANSKTYLESFTTNSAPPFWESYVTRLAFDSKGRELQEKVCSCTGCASFFAYAKRHLFTVTECRRARGKWVQKFVVRSPRSTSNHKYSKCIGQEFGQENSVTESAGISLGVAMGPFTASASYSRIASSLSRSTWTSQSCVERSWEIKPGPTVAVWQYEMSSRCYNEKGLYLQDSTFMTDIFEETTGSTPSCSPNNGNCGSSR